MFSVSFARFISRLYENRSAQRGNSLIFYHILSTNSLRECIENSLENLYVDIGLKGLIDEAWTTLTDLQYCCLVVWLVHRSAVQELNNKLRR